MKNLGKAILKILRNKYFRILVLIACLGIIVWQSIGLYNDSKEYNIASNEYTALTQDAVTIPETEEVLPVDTYPPLQIDYAQLKGINEDFVAWLYFPYFDISYPVVQETEIDEYLKKTFEGTYNSSGCLFIDILSSPDFTGMHDIIFGHNMRNGSMFGKLKQLSQSEDLDMIRNDPYIYVYTEKAVYQYEIFAYYVTTDGSDAYKVVTTDEEYDEFIAFTDQNSKFQKSISLDLSTRPSVLTLSTCSGRSGSGKRFVIHSAKVNTWYQE